MKIYFFLLSVLFVSATITRLLSLTVETDPLLSLKILADIALFAVCLVACHGLAFRRRYLTMAFWAWPGRLTLVMAGVHVMATLFRLDETTSPFWPIDLGMAVVIYGLFAVPAILYAEALKNDPELKQKQ
ncbi:hypothetical protein SAMN05660653_00688 [Desulfonatronum thiosulfatophilum]|uniref:Uncharacterized protein n=1 Tax=Desulfonatronum thiosulfatophilum TaxID=617002 RepID=A0A1G6AZW9_9BACT|nr:hypothetical protein [Desulfonatronum thiosulfatophilum]SDB13885.1 hypothetical protein SAMN05660653_00688 [Desulfonatronum thiosulfatophilum]